MKKLKKMTLANRCSLHELAVGMQPLGAIDLAAMIGGLHEQLSISGGVLENVEGGVLFTGNDGSTCLFEGATFVAGGSLPGSAYQMSGTIHISYDWLNDKKYPFNVNNFAHEFGHYLQQQEMGLGSYLVDVAAPSGYDMALRYVGCNPGYAHNELPYEKDADDRGKKYMEEHMKKPK